jgi:hemoglobin-like flavoprotein
MHWFPDRMIGETNLMRPDQIACIREAFDRLWPVNRRFADLFYARLFELDPTARTLFRERPRGFEDEAAQHACDDRWGAADRPEIFDSVVEDLGRSHALFGVTPAQYSAVGEALIWSLGEALGPALTRSRREAWSDFYKVVQLSMLRGAARV